MTTAQPLERVYGPSAQAAVVFAADVYRRTARRIPYSPSVAVAVLQEHAMWAHVDRRLPLDVEVLFRRDVIGVAVSQLPYSSPATLARRRALLLRVAEALGVTERSLPPLAGSTPSSPYGLKEVASLRVWASLQREDRVRDAWMLLSLGLGAGLTARELMTTSAADIDTNGTVSVRGVNPRRVPVRHEWWPELSALTAEVDATAPLFRPHIATYANKIGDFVRSSWGDGPRPTVQRLRATWLVTVMSDGLPIQDLLYVAGVKSLDALARFERFLPPSLLAVP